MAIYSSVQIVLSFPHKEGITLGAGEEVDEVAGGASGMDVDWIGEVGDRACEGNATRAYVAGFTAGSLARKGVRGETRGTGAILISFLDELTIFMEK